ncbi:nitroreductase family protein [Desulfotalea psychrophila]|uniref:4Fe-4S ferredoxin-type domain-containing protein n=1 Tax=Desulfotalea psychrophila (strain LSv54 / DSM 12343) TaxID=177439 RepID=Q6APS1_DESPS|nr:nitroreductase family protein [Desulfotalea psychrophila]CAG35653.1 hypothetical protein DP0924 [Desulfotalea psychrophila LSv54]
MVDFTVDEGKCIGCGQCVADCPLSLLEMRDGIPLLARRKQQFCIGCLHCFAVCDEAALSILGHDPLQAKEISRDLLPKPAQMEMLIRGRRSIRNYQNRNLAPELIDDLLDTAWQAPTGRNVRGLLFSVVDDKAVLADIRQEMLAEIQRLDEGGLIDEDYSAFAKFPSAWEEGYDVLFCKAPHLLVVSAADDLPTPMQDAVIAMTTFELYAQSHGVGTLWDGLATIALRDLVPAMQKRLGIPEGHHLCYAMCFGYPALHYARMASRDHARVERVR